MKTKAEIVQNLLDKDQITAEDAVILLKSEKEVIRETITIRETATIKITDWPEAWITINPNWIREGNSSKPSFYYTLPLAYDSYCQSTGNFVMGGNNIKTKLE